MESLSVKNVSFAYEDGENSRIVIDDVSFSVAQGEYVTLAGANGSGKSTLARLICGFLRPLSGTVQIKNAAGSSDLPELFVAGAVPSGMVFQSPRDQLVANTAERDIAFGPQNLHLEISEIKDRTAQSLELAGLLEHAAQKTVTLSSGQKQKLAFAGIIALFPRLLVLDEAASMIDRQSREALLGFITPYHAAGNTVIQVTHARDEISLSSRVLFLEKGKLVFDGNPADFFTSSAALSYTESVPSASAKLLSADNQVSFMLDCISFSYPAENDVKKSAAKTLFSNFNLSLRRGTVTALMGKSGSGKTTLMEIACGLLTPQAGSVRCAQRPVIALQESEVALFEEFAADDVAFGLVSRGIEGRELKERTRQAMDSAGLPFAVFADRHTFSLSGGEKRKLSLAGVIAVDSDVYFFDEPTAGLDVSSASTILGVLNNLAEQGKTVVFSTHRLEETVCAHRIITLEGGKITADNDSGVPDNFVNDSGFAPELCEQKPLEGAKVISSLEKTAFGSYNSLQSPVHRLAPVVKYLFLLFFCCAGIILRTFSLLGALIFIELVYAFAARYPFSRFVRNFFLVLPWIGFFFILQVLFIQSPLSDPILFSFGFITITEGKILFAVLTVLHYLSLLVPLSVFMFSTDEGEILDGMQRLLSPLALMRIPVQHAVLVTGMLFRFVPLLAEEASLILKAQLVRGGQKSHRGLFKNVRSMLPVFIPLILQTLKRAAALADALDARYYGKVPKPASLRKKVDKK